MEDNFKGTKFHSAKKDWTEFLDFLLGVFLSGIAGASVGFALLILS